MIMRPLAICVGFFLCAWSSPADASDEEQLAELTVLREQYPHDVDHALARGQLLARIGENDAALEDLREASRLAPDYEDVWRVYAAVLMRENDEASRMELQAVVAESARRFPESSWWQNAVLADEPAWTIVAGAGHDKLDNNAPSWNQLFANASHARDWGSYRFGLSRDSRFGATDITLSVGAGTQFAANWSAGIDIATVSDPKFLPEWSYGGFIGRSLPGDWLLNLRYLQREYTATSVSSQVVVVEKYVRDYRIAYALGHSRPRGVSGSLSHSMTLNWYYSDRGSIGINFNTGEETEAIGAGQVLQTDVNGVGLTGRRRINERLDLNWWLGTHKQGDYYRRTFLGMAVTYRL
jgi:YaiO family outer membrane protein